MNNENNLKTWNRATSQTAPTREDLQFMRSLDCRPEFLGSNLWQTASTPKEGIVYRQQVYFAGFSSDSSHGMKLNIECTCPARVECKHVLKLQRVYCANWSYLFILFGIEESVRFGELWSRARAVYERIEFEAQRREMRRAA